LLHGTLCSSNIAGLAPSDHDRDHWARNTSPNPDVKVFIGAPGSPETVGQGYVDIETLSNIAQDTQNRYPSFGGVMLWDACAAYSKCTLLCAKYN